MFRERFDVHRSTICCERRVRYAVLPCRPFNPLAAEGRADNAGPTFGA